MSNSAPGPQSMRCPKCNQTDRTDFSKCRFCGTRYDAVITKASGGGVDVGGFLRSWPGFIVLLVIVAFVARPIRNMLIGTAVNSSVQGTSQTITDSNAALQANPKDFDALVKRGDAYMVVFRTDKAVEDYTAAIALRPKSAELYRKRAAAYDALSNADGAKQDIEAAKALEH
jgi:hypothetical protein